MLKNIIRGEQKTEVEYYLTFDLDDKCGFAFPCDKYGQVKRMNEDREENLKWCLEHPDEFETFKVIVERRIKWREPDKGTCACGETVMLTNQFYGACQCPRCGRWYNLFGESIKSPEYWEKVTDEFDGDEY